MHSQLKIILGTCSLFMVFVIYACTSIFMKLASYEEPFSHRFFLYFGISVLILGCYAFLWQIILKKIPLTIAYTSKSLTIVISLFISSLIFEEEITLTNTIGAGLIMVGVISLPYNR